MAPTNDRILPAAALMGSIVMRPAELCNPCEVTGVSELVVGTVKTRTLESDRRSSVDPPKGSIPTVGTHL